MSVSEGTLGAFMSVVLLRSQSEEARKQDDCEGWHPPPQACVPGRECFQISLLGKGNKGAAPHMILSAKL